MNPNVVIDNTSGLATHGNDLSAEPGSTSVADNVTFGRERLPETRRGFKDFSTNIPDFAPAQLLVGSNGTDRYLHLDSGLWYYDTTSSTWLRKQGTQLGGINAGQGAVVVSGHLYFIATISCIVDLNLTTGAMSVLAGIFNAVTGTADGTGAAARFNGPSGICSDGTNLYVCDLTNHTIRKIVIATGVVTTLAGTAGASGDIDATGAAARFNSPTGICTDNTNLYVTDQARFVIRKIVISSGVVTTIAGTAGTSGTTDATGAAARFTRPWGICTDNTNLYIADNHGIRKLVISSAVVTTLAGAVASSGSMDGTGTSARFTDVFGDISYDGTNLWVGDSGNYTIRKIVIATGVVTTPFGTAGSSGSADGVGAAARFSGSGYMAASGTGAAYIVRNNAVRKLYLDTLYAYTLTGTVAAIAPPTLGDGLFSGPS